MIDDLTKFLNSISIYPSEADTINVLTYLYWELNYDYIGHNTRFIKGFYNPNNREGFIVFVNSNVKRKHIARLFIIDDNAFNLKNIPEEDILHIPKFIRDFYNNHQIMLDYNDLTKLYADYISPIARKKEEDLTFGQKVSKWIMTW